MNGILELTIYFVVQIARRSRILVLHLCVRLPCLSMSLDQKN